MAGVGASPEWELQAVVRRLREKTAQGVPVSAQVFVMDDVPVGEIAAAAKRIVECASVSLNLSPGAVRIGKVRSLAKSFSVTSDVADVFEAIAGQDVVKAMLETEQADILPRPRNRKIAL
jgi:hypothetical protein